jgi:peptidoglycan/LPS O-acetylase OafA/YrhL
MAFGRGAISRALSIKPLVLLGEASFALYLVHQILITFYYLNLPHFAGIPDLALCVSYWALSIGAAFALWAFIEKPARDWIRHLLSRERKTEAATAMQ